MKIAALVCRILLGLTFLVFGLNGLFPFIPQGPMPTGPAGQFLGVLISTHYIVVPSAVMVVTGALFLVNRFVPLALVLIAPVIVNILVFHLCMNPGGIVPGTLVTLFWFVVALRERSASSGLMRARNPN
ncbi:MAG TPA: DoxX family protein [Opitutaceae bacterium]